MPLASRFIDQANIYVKAGDGGKGCVAFRREKYVPFGGPAGGDGGDGGDVVFKVSTDLNTLLDLRYRPHLKAANGGQGLGDKRTGKKGRSLILKVPPGTMFFDAETGELLADLVDLDQEVMIAQGGKGGKGNARFATAKNRAPRKFENGTLGEERRIRLELKSIADVGLVGLPNAGKSTLLRAISKATPEVAPYPFTTLIPHLGVVEKGVERFVVADIPGLIEGASQGKGLGYEFLRHIERTAVLLYVVDASSFGSAQEGWGPGPIADFMTVRREVLAYSEEMRSKGFLVAINKIDLLDPQDAYELKTQMAEIANGPVFLISASCQTGLEELLKGICNILEIQPQKKKDF